MILLNHDDPISIAKREPRATGDTLLGDHGDHKCIVLKSIDQRREILDIVIDHPSNSMKFWGALSDKPILNHLKSTTGQQAFHVFQLLVAGPE